jgi:hypothetical protein
MTILHETEVSGDLVVSLARSLVVDTSDQWVDFVDRQLSQRDLSTLTNLRQLWFELYDRFQDEFE